jgi:hypothetical protein
MTIYRKHNRTEESTGAKIRRMRKAAEDRANFEAARNSDRAIIRQDDRASLDLVREMIEID